MELDNIFFSATVRDLVIRGCFFQDNDVQLVINSRVQMSRATPLRTLSLLDCNINVSAFSNILRIPRALEAITLRQQRRKESLTRITDWEQYTNTAAESYQDFVDSLLKQKHSLRTMDLTKALPVDWRRETELLIDCDFSEFEVLESLCIDGRPVAIPPR